MSDIKVGREHLAGLELADELLQHLPGFEQDMLDGWIAQASAAPEQEPVAMPETVGWVWIEERNGEDFDIGFSFGSEQPNFSVRHPGQSFSYSALVARSKVADPSEVERLRAELIESDKCVVRALNERDAATQRADAAEQLLGERDALLQKIRHAWECTEGHEALFDVMQELSASAEHAKCLNCGGCGLVGRNPDHGEPCPDCNVEPAKCQTLGCLDGIAEPGRKHCKRHQFYMVREPAKGGDGEVQS